MQELVTDNNLYRAMIAAFTFLFVEKLYLFLADKWILFQEYGYIVIFNFYNYPLYSFIQKTN